MFWNQPWKHILDIPCKLPIPFFRRNRLILLITTLSWLLDHVNLLPIRGKSRSLLALMKSENLVIERDWYLPSFFFHVETYISPKTLMDSPLRLQNGQTIQKSAPFSFLIWPINVDKGTNKIINQHKQNHQPTHALWRQGASTLWVFNTSSPFILCYYCCFSFSDFIFLAIGNFFVFHLHTRA